MGWVTLPSPRVNRNTGRAPLRASCWGSLWAIWKGRPGEDLGTGLEVDVVGDVGGDAGGDPAEVGGQVGGDAVDTLPSAHVPASLIDPPSSDSANHTA